MNTIPARRRSRLASDAACLVLVGKSLRVARFAAFFALAIACALVWQTASGLVATAWADEFASEQYVSPCVPTEEQLAAYEADGSLDARLAYAEEHAHTQPDASLVQRALARQNAANGIATASVPTTWQGGIPSTGNVRVLALRVDFPAEDGEPAMTFDGGDTLDALKALLDATEPGQAGTDAIYPYESLNSYYQRSSYGKLSFSTDAYNYTAKHARSYYSDPAELFLEALETLDASIDYNDYDADGDGAIDAVYLHFAGPDTGWSSAWWSACSTYGGDATFDGVKPSRLIKLHEASDSAIASRTLIHETGHALGLPDYYSYETQQGGVADRTGSFTFAMMDKQAGDQDGFAKWMLGWIDESQVTRVIANKEGITVKRGGQVIVTAQPGSDGTTSLEQTLGAFTSDELEGTGGIIVVSNEDAGIFSSYYLVQYEHFAGNQSVYYTDSAGEHPLPDGFRIFRIRADLTPDGADFLYTNTYGQIGSKLIEMLDPDLEAVHSEVDGVPNAAAQGYGCMLYTGSEVTPDTYPSTNFFENEMFGYTGLSFKVDACETDEGTLTISHNGKNAPEAADFSLSLDAGQKAANMGVLTLTASSAPRIAATTASGQEASLVVDGVPHQVNLSVDATKVSASYCFDAAAIKPDSSCTLVLPAGQFIVGEKDGVNVLSSEISLPVAVDSTAVMKLAESGAVEGTEGARDAFVTNTVDRGDGHVCFLQHTWQDGWTLHCLDTARPAAATSVPVAGLDAEANDSTKPVRLVALPEGKVFVAGSNAEGLCGWWIDAQTGKIESTQKLSDVMAIPQFASAGNVVLQFGPASGEYWMIAAWLPDGQGGHEARYALIEAEEVFSMGQDCLGVMDASYVEPIGTDVAVLNSAAVVEVLVAEGAVLPQEAERAQAALAGIQPRAMLHLADYTGVRIGAASDTGYALLALAKPGDTDATEANLLVVFDAEGVETGRVKAESFWGTEVRSSFESLEMGDGGALALSRQGASLSGNVDEYETVLFGSDLAVRGHLLTNGAIGGIWTASGGWLALGKPIDANPWAAGAPPKEEGAIARKIAEAGQEGFVAGEEVADEGNLLRYYLTEPIDIAGGDDPDDPDNPDDPDEIPWTELTPATPTEPPSGEEPPADNSGSKDSGLKKLASTGDPLATWTVPVLALVVTAVGAVTIIARYGKSRP